MYRDLPILTARPTKAEESCVPHRLYGMLAAHEQCSAGAWLRLAKMEIDWALAQGKLPIVVGGSGLYLNALLKGIADIPDIPESVRAQATNDYEVMGKEAFAARLREVDPEFFTRLNVYDKQRLIRAYAVWLGTGKSLSFWQQQKTAPAYPMEHFSIHLIDLPRDEIYRRCDTRFLKMIDQGAVEEVRVLFPPPGRGRTKVGVNIHSEMLTPTPTLPFPGGGISKVIGVAQIMEHLQGKTTLETAIAVSQQATRNYAKRQLTWFRHQLMRASKATGPAEILNFIDQKTVKH